MTPQNKLLAAIGTLAISWYFFSIYYIGIISPLDGPNAPVLTPSENPLQVREQGVAFKQFMAVSITTLAATLATYVGMVLGFQQAGVAAPDPNANPAPTPTQLSHFQLVAAWAYVASLIFALGIWWFRGESCHPSIVNLGQSFIGLVGGALAVMLNVRQ